MREQIPVTTALALAGYGCYLYAHILEPRDCRHPRGSSWCRAAGSAGLTPRHDHLLALL